MKGDMNKANKLEEEKSKVSFGKGDVNLQDLIKAEYLLATPFTDIKVPSKVEIKIPAHKQEATCVCFNSIGDAVVTGGADTLVKVWSANTGKEV
jgi:WD40 repeat protein